ncbi:MAG TPA: aspartate/glutamate racemase family protein [Xanthobacteraceae bacterium]|nr:aspartate/glutamate racemase family protein [Xanthobacteraceae bacterium]
MRIWHQSLTVLEHLPAYAERVRAHIARIKRPDTVVDLHGMHRATYPADYPGDDIAYSFLFQMHSLQWAQNALQAAKEGYDAFAMCTLADPLHREIRSLVDIPVVAAGEVCFHVAAMLGSRFGLMLFIDRLAPRYLEQIEATGLGARCAGIGPTGVTFQEVQRGFENPGPVIDKFRAAARDLIARGADVIIPGEIPLSVLLASEGVNRVDDVPLIDSLGVTIKMTETFVDLRAATGLAPSRHGWRNAAPKGERVAQVMDFYLGASPIRPK